MSERRPDSLSLRKAQLLFDLSTTNPDEMPPRALLFLALAVALAALAAAAPAPLTIELAEREVC